MPATSKSQRRFMAMAEHGVIPEPEGMSRDQMHDYATTPEKGLPAKVRKPKRSSKMKRFREIMDMGPGE
jgi:hypothetical protein